MARTIAALAMMAAVSAGQNAPPPMTAEDKAIRRYLAARAADLEREFLPEVKSAADFDRLRPELRRQYLYMLGLDPLPERTPLKPVVTGRIEGDGFAVEKVHFQSRPGLYVTANLYLPRSATGRHPAILYSCGHYGRQGRHGNKTAADCQAHGIWFATHGYVCLAVDTLQLGEIAATHHGTYRYERWWWHAAGYTPAGVECWNAVRAIDYLQTRPEVDPDRIGATGISGGGAATFWIAAADERVKVAVPVSGMADLTFYVGEDGVNGHCDCMFLHNQARWNWTGIAALVCPRPMLFANSDSDRIFPMSANDRVIARLERLYSHFGAGDLVDATVSVGGHDYRTDLRRAIYGFFNRHLKSDAGRVEDADQGYGPEGKPRLAPEELRVFPRDADLPSDEVNTRIDESFVAPARPAPPEPAAFEAWRGDLLGRLRKASFNAWPSAFPSTPIALGSAPRRFRELTEDGIEIPLAWLPGRGDDRWLIVLNQDEDAASLPAWAAGVVKGAPALLLKPRGGWTRRNPPNTVERSMALLGATVDGGRVWDAVNIVRRTGRWRAAGRGEAGVLAAYAALYAPEIEAVAAVEPPASHRAGPSFLNVLRVLDIPEALGCLAPRALEITGASPAFERTAALYRAAGAGDRLQLR